MNRFDSMTIKVDDESRVIVGTVVFAKTRLTIVPCTKHKRSFMEVIHCVPRRRGQCQVKSFASCLCIRI